ncbi:ninja-family protein AFP3-like [Bidens hawaiensis]|uniref:ninja-family protein AFP3-like n=1 Tax=Bidens hawaiensis TaxID=980011 RepID=UPI00404B6D05
MKENQDSRNMLQRFTCREEHGRSDNVVELNIGLSLNGRFGPESPPQRSVTIDDNDNKNIVTDNINKLYGASSITRTSSLPQRKQLQSLRRLEAKRKRVEKLKNARMVKGKKQDEQSLPFSTFDETMPCVTTKGGKRIRGLLYRYGEEDEEVIRIVCVCHG